MAQVFLGAAGVYIESLIKSNLTQIPDFDFAIIGNPDQKLIYAGIDHACLSARSRSSIRSSAASMPQESRIMPSLTSALFSSSLE